MALELVPTSPSQEVVPGFPASGKTVREAKKAWVMGQRPRGTMQIKLSKRIIMVNFLIKILL